MIRRIWNSIRLYFGIVGRINQAEYQGDKGQTWKSMQIDPSDAQTLETRRYQVSEIARIFGVPLHLRLVGAKEDALAEHNDGIKSAKADRKAVLVAIDDYRNGVRGLPLDE
jgi:hypothetical protein